MRLVRRLEPEKWVTMRVLLVLICCSLGVGALFGQSRKGHRAAPHTHTLLGKPAKNVILFVGDDMGLTQISAGMYSSAQPLHIEDFPITGLQKAYTGDNLAADVAASAAALASGVKVPTGNILRSTREKHQARTLLQEAETKGLATGILVNMDLTDAFPAAFIGQKPDSLNREHIAEAYLESGIDLFIGGGRKSFTGARANGQHLIDVFQEKEYQISDYTKATFPKITLDLKKNAGFLVAEDADTAWIREPEKYLAASRLAAVFLKAHNPKGFILVVGLDQATSSAQDSSQLVTDILAFDAVLGGLLDFARQDGETLLVVTANEERGGFAINPGSQKYKLLTENNAENSTAIMLPVFAFGPGSSLFSGIYENTEIQHRIRKALGWQ